MEQKTMRAIVQRAYGGPEVFQMEDVPRPQLRSRDILVRVRAIGINPVDAKVRERGAPGEVVPNAPRILGWDGSGTVVACGPDATLFSEMDQVYFAGDLTRAGSYAEYLAIDERIVANMPRTLTFEECAGLPLTALTAWEALVEHIGMTPVAIPESVAQTPTTDDAPRSLHAAERKRDSSDKSTTNGKHLLLVGGAGGVGSIAIQIASAVCGVPVVATASRPESRRRCLNLGAEHVLDHGKPLTPQLKSIGIDGVDYVFTTADLMNFGDLVETLNPLGHICTIQGGEGARTADLNKLKTKRGTFSYEYVFTRPVTGWYPEKQGEILATVAQLIDTGTLKSTVEKILPWERVEEAHRQIDSKHTLGKVVLRVPND